MDNTRKKLQAFSLIEVSIVILIIGILIIGVIESSSLVTMSKINSARALTNSSPVSSIPDLYAWFETTTENSYAEGIFEDLEDGDLITTWNDINPQNRNRFTLTQSTTNYKPTYNYDSTLGIPTLIFDGTDDVMTSTTNFGITGNPDFTIFVVASVSGGSYGPFLTFGNPSTCDWLMFGRNNNSSENGELYNGFYASGQNFTHANVGTDSIFAIHTWRRTTSNGSNNDHTGNTVYTNGTSQTLTNQGTACTPSITASVLSVGSDPEGRDLNGEIGEIIVFNRALKTEERVSVENYLSQKWNIALD